MGASVQIVGIGLATLDILMRLGKMPTWEDGARLREMRMDGGGPVGTGMVAAARLGARVGFIGTCGSDEIARLKMDLLTRYGVDTSRVICRPGPEEQIVMVYVQESSGERAFAMVDGLRSNQLAEEELDREYITSADFLELDGFHCEAGIQAAHWMHAAGKKVMLDAGKSNGPVSRQMCSLVEVTDFLICGAGFACGLTGLQDRWAAAEALLAMGPRVVVQTEGDDGSYTSAAGERFHTPAFDVPVVDTTGAGDVFHGAYLVGLARGWDLRRTAIYATAVSALKCTHLGGRAGIPTDAEVRAFLRERGYEMEFSFEEQI